MSSFLPSALTSFYVLLIILSVEFFVGYVLVRKQIPIWLAWSFPLASVIVQHATSLNEAPGFRMVALILVLLTGMKIVVALHYPSLRFTFIKWFLYCFAWVGMNPTIFFKRNDVTDYKLLYRGLIFFTLGLAVLILLRFIVNTSDSLTGTTYWLMSLMILIALSQILHFGLLNISAVALQMLHYPAYSLFRSPLQANSLRDFWGKRWNLAFTEMTSVVAYRPLRKRLSDRQAFIIAFLFSGLLHEVALSLPVNKGYGLPTLYFIIQLILILLEPILFGTKKPGSLWIVACLVIPLPILFHKAIMTQVFWKVILV